MLELREGSLEIGLSTFRVLIVLRSCFVLSVWEERKGRLYGEHANVQQSHSQND